MLKKLAPEVGFEPTTLRLTAATEAMQLDDMKRLTIPSITSRSQRPVHRVTAISIYSYSVRSHIGHMNGTGQNPKRH